MAQIADPRRIAGLPRPADRRTAIAVGATLVAVAVVVSVGDPGRFAWVRTFFVIFGSLLIQALPFVMIGALAAALVEVFVPIGTFEKLGTLPRPLQLPAAALAGIAFPICECGSVPVARRLMQRGLMPSAAVTFMLAAPVLNPVVIASTFVAFRGRTTLWTMVGGRFLLGMVVAIAVGWVIGNRSKDELLKPNPEEAHEHLLELGRPEARWRRFFVHLGNDFLFMGRFLLLGATIAAAIQTFLPTSVLTGLAERPVVSVLAMMGLAAALSLCSESDAFVAASFVQFGPSAMLGLPGVRADGRPEARRPVRGDVPPPVHADGRPGRRGRHPGRRALGGCGVRMTDSVVARTGTRVRAETGPPRRWSPGGVAGALVLAAWAGLFWFLWLSGREAFYLSTRTDWVVPVAAVLLTAATIGRLASARVVTPKPLAARELWIMGLMVVPVVLVLFAPVTTLGAFSADKRAGFSGTGFATSSGDIGSGELTLVDVASAETSPEGERALAKRAGETVRFVGFVSIRDDTPADEFLLARYVVSCCVADATIAEVRVVNVTPGQFANEDWVEVTGTIYPIGREVIVDASTIAEVARPDHPYLTP